MNNRRRFPPILLMVLLILVSFFAGFTFSQSLSRPASQLPPEFDTLSEVWQTLENYYVNKEALDPDELSEAAINGLLEALGDPYTSYVDAETYKLSIPELEGSFEGIGAVIAMEDGEITVVSPIAGSPAEAQGIRAGDKILEIDGQPTSGMSLAEAVLKIRGPQGTKVTLLILHPGETTPLEVEVIRAQIELDSVYLKMLPDDIAYIQITYFTERTHEELVAALNDAIETGAKGIILDLRNNPGGYLHIVVEVADEFLDGGIVLYQADDDGNITREWPASPGGLATDLPLVLLVNGGSASGSEVLAGALQDRERAPLIGTTTYGSGSVKAFYELSDGSALYLTTGRWLTPNGRLIEGVGLTPDIEVAMTEEDIESGRDPQLERAIEYIEEALKLEMLEGV